jgi:hypothetical protein
LTHTLAEVSAERFDEWFRLLEAAMAVLGFDASRYVTALAEENKNRPPGYLPVGYPDG